MYCCTLFFNIHKIKKNTEYLLLSSGNGLGIRVVGGKEIPGSRGEIGAYIAKVIPGGAAEQTGKFVEGKCARGGESDYFALGDNVYLKDILKNDAHV